jgi:hypothetical protein
MLNSFVTNPGQIWKTFLQPFDRLYLERRLAEDFFQKNNRLLIAFGISCG